MSPSNSSRLPADFHEETPVAHPAIAAAKAREPGLARLAELIVLLNPELARALCEDGLRKLAHAPEERAEWEKRLAPFLEGEHGDVAFAA